MARHMVRRRPTRLIVAVVSIALLAAGAAGAFIYQKAKERKAAGSAALQLATAWSQNKIETVTFANVSSADAQNAYRATTGNLVGTPVTVRVAKTSVDGGSARSTLNVDWSFGKGQWKYDSTVELRKQDGRWKPVWTPAMVNPSLTPSTHLAVKRVQPPRADILGANGQTLVTTGSVVDVGVTPQRTTDIDGLSRTLATILQIDGDALSKQVKAAKPDAFVSVITLRRSDYDAVKARLQPLAGTVFRETTQPLAPSRQFASALLGRVGPVTADVVDASKGRYQAGDVGGLSGVQLQYDEQLAGSPGTTVSAVDADVNVPARQLFAIDPTPGTPLRMTIDAKAQQSADAAIASQKKPTSFVAIQASTGAVLAAANGPDVGGTNRAFTAQYPPGSSFKVVSTYALLQRGLSIDEQVACPPTFTVDGRAFKNAEDEAFASAPFRKDFAMSCNTAFASLAPKVSGSALPDAAKAFGLTNSWQAGVGTFSGSVPTPASAVDLAATTFGQGRTLMSPLAMANVAAGVSSGTARAPFVITDPTREQPAPSPLNVDAINSLRTVMREVVTSGTGSAARNAAGGPVFGKTGTAEFGTKDPPESHAWFIGYQGDIAFAAFVEGGEFGGETAAPIAASFLTNLAR